MKQSAKSNWKMVLVVRMQTSEFFSKSDYFSGNSNFVLKIIFQLSVASFAIDETTKKAKELLAMYKGVMNESGVAMTLVEEELISGIQSGERGLTVIKNMQAIMKAQERKFYKIRKVNFNDLRERLQHQEAETHSSIDNDDVGQLNNIEQNEANYREETVAVAQPTQVETNHAEIQPTRQASPDSESDSIIDLDVFENFDFNLEGQQRSTSPMSSPESLTDGLLETIGQCSAQNSGESNNFYDFAAPLVNGEGAGCSSAATSNQQTLCLGNTEPVSTAPQANGPTSLDRNDPIIIIELDDDEDDDVEIIDDVPGPCAQPKIDDSNIVKMELDGDYLNFPMPQTDLKKNRGLTIKSEIIADEDVKTIDLVAGTMKFVDVVNTGVSTFSFYTVEPFE